MTYQERLENVIKAFKLCTSDIDTRTCVPCELCKYHNNEYHGVSGFACNIRDLMRDALELLEAREPRVMTLDEAKKLERDTVVWYEHKGKNKPRPRIVDEIVYCDIDEYLLFSDGGKWYFKSDNYGTQWRCWTSFPDDERRQNTPWN